MRACNSLGSSDWSLWSEGFAASSLAHRWRLVALSVPGYLVPRPLQAVVRPCWLLVVWCLMFGRFDIWKEWRGRRNRTIEQLRFTDFNQAGSFQAVSETIMKRKTIEAVSRISHFLLIWNQHHWFDQGVGWAMQSRSTDHWIPSSVLHRHTGYTRYGGFTISYASMMRDIMMGSLLQ